ncbi:unnamed protein product [Vitrella brassicaformis CCMP3155]|uniref:RING-type domain-containing protein n=1 Tax=Vitrella brassicaformis (strain CCMP3155) TaxID=1169540 RepID=A0A0G4E9K3_VITBC|nr:unnamed protein product [Vitrella brassicaformis CCMP3155]|eukprot:CEL92088.1 unnamed protein product [Vitrella brassicaformis CCMP3155]
MVHPRQARDWARFVGRPRGYPGEVDILLDPQDTHSPRKGFPPLSDEDATHFAEWLQRPANYQTMMSPGSYLIVNMNCNKDKRESGPHSPVIERGLHNSGTIAVMNAFISLARRLMEPAPPRQIHLDIRILKLYRNHISDTGATAIADLIRALPTALEELHLSHNHLTARGAKAIIEAFDDGRKRGLYPKNRGGPFPVWLRMENQITPGGIDGRELNEFLVSRKITFCQEMGRDGGRETCGTKFCKHWDTRRGESCPLLHLGTNAEMPPSEYNFTSRALRGSSRPSTPAQQQQQPHPPQQQHPSAKVRPSPSPASLPRLNSHPVGHHNNHQPPPPAPSGPPAPPHRPMIHTGGPGPSRGPPHLQQQHQQYQPVAKQHQASTPPRTPSNNSTPRASVSSGTSSSLGAGPSGTTTAKAPAAAAAGGPPQANGQQGRPQQQTQQYVPKQQQPPPPPPAPAPPRQPAPPPPKQQAPVPAPPKVPAPAPPKQPAPKAPAGSGDGGAGVGVRGRVEGKGKAQGGGGGEEAKAMEELKKSYAMLKKRYLEGLQQLKVVDEALGSIECTMCMDAKRTHVIAMCGHTICSRCASEQQLAAGGKCPWCQKEISFLHKVEGW